LVERIGYRCRHEHRKVDVYGPVLELQSLGPTGAIFIVDLVVHPVTQEQLLVMGQFH
jgi:hypothetical protein